jgi:hypothetical protein
MRLAHAIAVLLLAASCGDPTDPEINSDASQLAVAAPYTAVYGAPYPPGCTPPSRLRSIVFVRQTSSGYTLDHFWQRNCPSGMDCSVAYFVDNPSGGADYMSPTTQGGRQVNCSVKAAQPIYGACWFLDGDGCFDFFTLAPVTGRR